MTAEEKRAFVRDGLSRRRHANFAASETAIRSWEREHPRSLDDFIEFLDSLQSVFGPFPVDRSPWRDDGFRL